MRVEARGAITDTNKRPKERKACAFVALSAAQSGAMFCVFQTGPTKHDPTATLGLCRSRDGGATWEEIPFEFQRVIGGVPGELACGEIVEGRPGQLQLFATWFDRSDPNRPLFDNETQGLVHSKQLRAFSSDDGDSWSPWEEIATPGLTGCAQTGPLLRWSDSFIAFPFESYREFDDPVPAHHAAWILVSRDGGQTFDKPCLVAQDPKHRIYYWDQRLCVGAHEGELIAMFWAHDLAAQKDLPVHLRRATLRGNRLEGGPILDTGITGQLSAPLLLPDGRVLAFVVDHGTPATMMLWQSRDAGTTWPRQDSIIVYTHDEQAILAKTGEQIEYTECWADMLKWSFGHPAIRPLGGNKVLVAYYAGIPNQMSVYWARVDVSTV